MAGAPYPCSEHGEDDEHTHNQALPVIHAFPHRHTKVIHFVRHGEGYHNGMPRHRHAYCRTLLGSIIEIN